MDSLRKRLFAPIDIAVLVYFRIALGGLLIWEILDYLGSGQARELWVRPDFHFKYVGFGWVEPLPGEGMLYLLVGLAFVALGIMLGWFYRLMTILFFVGFTYIFLIDQAKYMNHFYLICLLAFVAIWLPASRCFSLDVKRHPETARSVVPAWTLWLLRAQVGIVYFYGGIAKINQDWLAAEPIRAWLQQRSDLAVVGDLLALELTAWFFAYGGLLFDLLVVPFLPWKPTRGWAFLVALVFHLTNSLLFSIGIFPYLGIALTALFFDPSWPRQFGNWLRGLWSEEPTDKKPRRSKTRGKHQKITRGLSPEETTSSSRRARIVMALLFIYLALQVLIPFRHWLYPGSVHWTEEGHRFSWHMMLRSKTSEAVFTIHDPSSGQTRTAQPLNHLTGSQYLKMINRPDMILQFCHHLAATEVEKGVSSPEVRARVSCRLNGREPQLLVDPDIDLARQKRSLGHADWIVPLQE